MVSGFLFVRLRVSNERVQAALSSTRFSPVGQQEGWTPVPPMPSLIAHHLISETDRMLIQRACEFLASESAEVKTLYISLLWDESSALLRGPIKVALTDAALRILYATFPSPNYEDVDLIIFPPGPILHPSSGVSSPSPSSSSSSSSSSPSASSSSSSSSQSSEYFPLCELEVSYIFLVDFEDEDTGIYHPSITALPSSVRMVKVSLSGELSRPMQIYDEPQPTSIFDPSPANMRNWRAQVEAQPALLFDVTCVGGTFDHFHVGHKILVTMTTYVTRRVIELGVTSPSMLAKKAYLQEMEALEVREANTKRMIHLLNPGVEIHYTPLEDPYGPILKVPEMQVLVVSEETAAALTSANTKRGELGYAPIVGIVVGLLCPADAISDDSSSEVDEQSLAARLACKTSSSFIRERVALAKRAENTDHRVSES